MHPSSSWPAPSQTMFISRPATTSGDSSGLSTSQSASDSLAPTSAYASAVSSVARACRPRRSTARVSMPATTSIIRARIGRDFAGERAARLPVEHRPAVAVGGHVTEERPHPAPELLVRREVGSDDVDDRLHHPGALAVQAGDEQVFFGAEVGVHHGLGDVGAARDVVHRRVVEAVSGELDDGGVEHLPLAHAAGQALDGSSLTRLPAYLLVRKVTHE